MPLTALLTNCPDEETADTIASALIATRLVACANRYAPIASMYRWGNDIEQDIEVPLLVKTRPELADRVAAEIAALHPYVTPAIIRMTIEANADYLAWIMEETASPG